MESRLLSNDSFASLDGARPCVGMGTPPLTGNAAILAAHGKARASGWKCRRLEGGCPSQGCAQGVDWERRHLGGAWKGARPLRTLINIGIQV